MLVRIQWSQGIKRVNVTPQLTVSQLYDEVARALQLDAVSFTLCHDQKRQQALARDTHQSLQMAGLSHGDMLYLVTVESGSSPLSTAGAASGGAAAAGGGGGVTSHHQPMLCQSSVLQATTTSSNSSSSSSSATALSSMAIASQSEMLAGSSSGVTGPRSATLPSPAIVEDAVDQLLWTLDGKIARPRDPKQCHHGDRALCVHCAPLEPYNADHLQQNNIKHMSFHSYLRKLTDGVDRGKFASLEDISCRIKPGCSNHSPWPRGICSKCQPSAVTLNRQPYRHVDSVVFESASLVDRFLAYWRRTGVQRCGLLLGRYHQHLDVPLGIRATVAAIYEPPQLATRDQLQLLLLAFNNNNSSSSSCSSSSSGSNSGGVSGPSLKQQQQQQPMAGDRPVESAVLACDGNTINNSSSSSSTLGGSGGGNNNNSGSSSAVNSDATAAAAADAEQQWQLVVQLATALGLQPVGWLFTDLVTDDTARGTVKQLRGSDTWFLTAHECIMAGYLQSQFPNACRVAPSGQFGSKFVTVIVSGDSENQVHMEGYQLSNQGTALVRDGCLVPTLDAPELAWLRPSTDLQYVPDIFYKEKDAYGNEVSRLARPLPVAYLLVDVPVSTPLQPQHTFPPLPDHIRPFPIENRSLDGQCQDFNTLVNYLAQFGRDSFLQAVSDFHVLLYLAATDIINVKESVLLLVEAVARGDPALADQCYQCEQWQTVARLVEASRWAADSPPHMASDSAAAGAGVDVVGSGSGVGGGGGGVSQLLSTQAFATAALSSSVEAAAAAAVDSAAAAAAATGGTAWSCSYCTFINSSHQSTSCAMCQLPRTPL